MVGKLAKIVLNGLRVITATMAIGAAATTRCLADEAIGTWVLICPTDAKAEACRLRHRVWILPPGTGGPSIALEVMRRGGRAVPVIAVRGLSMQAAFGGVLAVQANVGLRFDNASSIGLACGTDGTAVVCAPDGADAKDAAEQIVSARSVLVRAQISLPGGIGLPEQSRSIDLERTPDALARLRADTAANNETAALPGLGLTDYLDRLLSAVGIGHTTTDTQAKPGR